MPNVRIYSTLNSSPELLLRQTKYGLGKWGACNFYFNDELDHYDWVCVLHNSALNDPIKIKCQSGNLVYVSMEPFEKLVLSSPGFLNQFDIIIAVDKKIKTTKKIIYKNIISWWVGLDVVRTKRGYILDGDTSLNLELLQNMPIPNKINRISVILSGKKITSGHVRRENLISELKKMPIGEYIDVYGEGYIPLKDKWLAIYPYKYHIVIENERVNGYWSEKIADSFLGYSMPIYDGCKDIHNFFSPGSLTLINSENIQETSLILTSLINSNDYFKINKIIEARNSVMDDYNLFKILSDICCKTKKEIINLSIKPNKSFIYYKINSVIMKVKNKIINEIK